MPNVPIDVDILIVGAGPVGLFLANECARRGLRFRIIEAAYSVRTMDQLYPATKG